MARLRLLAVALAALAALAPRLAVASQWGSPYGDPPGFCPAQSLLPGTYRALITNDPAVGNNPEQDTFFGYHSSPGYDDWFGYWYGDFRGLPGDDSGWLEIQWVRYPTTYHWNFSSWGWSVHGHAKQYIAYNNWTFDGQCGYPFPYMADVYGVPVLDIYVDSVPPASPRPRIAGVSPTAISFTWGPVIDQGDGSGPDYFAIGMDHYTSWLTVDGGAPIGRQDSPQPMMLSTSAGPAQRVCAFVTASDLLGNTSAPQSSCGTPAGSPPVPAPPPPSAVAANPDPGLAGLEGWFWLTPSPANVYTDETAGGVAYRVIAQPVWADWDFGDGATLAAAGFGYAYPTPSSVRHAYEAQSAAGYAVSTRVNYQLSWYFNTGGAWIGPYPLGTQSVAATPLTYAVRQAQPELLAAG